MDCDEAVDLASDGDYFHNHVANLYFIIIWFVHSVLFQRVKTKAWRLILCLVVSAPSVAVWN